jgi:hypothetical protein
MGDNFDFMRGRRLVVCARSPNPVTRVHTVSFVSTLVINAIYSKSYSPYATVHSWTMFEEADPSNRIAGQSYYCGKAIIRIFTNDPSVGLSTAPFPCDEIFQLRDNSEESSMT